MEVNWDAVAAITQIVATLVTVVAIIVSLRIASLPIASKAKIFIGRAGKFTDENHFVFLNVGHSKINLKAYGLFVSKTLLTGFKNAIHVTSKAGPIEINPAEDLVYKISNADISHNLVSFCNCKKGQKVKLILFFMDSKNKRFEKRFNFKIE